MPPRLTCYSEVNKMNLMNNHEYTYGNMTAIIHEYENNRDILGTVNVSFYCHVKNNMVRDKKRKAITIECHLPWSAIKRGEDFMKSGSLQLQLMFAMDILKEVR